MKEKDSYEIIQDIQDKNVAYVKPMNKANVATEYKKMYGTNLQAYNNRITHKAFAPLPLTTTFGIKNLDIKTRKIFHINGNINQNLDVNKLY